MPLNRRSLIVVALPLCVALMACAERFEVLVVNQMDSPARIGIAQYHSPDFKAEPPPYFSEKELIRQELVTLKPKEQRTLVYTSGAGGFWLQWRLLDPLPEPNPLHRLDLIRDNRRILIGWDEE